MLCNLWRIIAILINPSLHVCCGQLSTWQGGARGGAGVRGLVLERVGRLALAEDGDEHAVGAQVARLARVVPAVLHRHVVDGQGGPGLVLQQTRQLVASNYHIDVKTSLIHDNSTDYCLLCRKLILGPNSHVHRCQNWRR